MVDPERAAKVVELYEGGMTITNIAKVVHMEKKRVRKCLVTAGVKLRNRYKIIENEQELVDHWNAGLSVSAIAKKYNISRDRVMNLLERHGVKYKPRLLKTKLPVSTMISMYEKGLMSERAIARYFNVCKDTVNHHLKKNNVKKRTKPLPWHASKWKGGRTFDSRSGSQRIRVPRHPYFITHSVKNNYLLEHRVIAELCLGRLLTSRDIILHIDKDNTNKAPENLCLVKSRGVKCPTKSNLPPLPENIDISNDSWFHFIDWSKYPKS